jgi:hypothetical protein
MFSNFRKFWFCAVLLMMAFSVAAPSENSFKVYAQNAAVEARVSSVSGSATISGNGQNGTRLARGAILAPGHEIDTRGGGRVVIDLSDGSQVVVLPGSRLVVGDYRNAGSLRELLQITLGRIRVRINRFKNKPNPYRIKSPTASIAVRGTEFEVSVELSGETRVIVLEGAVEVASLRDSANPLLAEPGRNVVVRPDFTLDFFVPGITTKDAGSNNRTDAGNERITEAANVYARFAQNVIQYGETASPSRFTAFADAHQDSLDNPAYAAAFDSPEGRIYLAQSFSDASDGGEAERQLEPVNYSLGMQATVFVPVKRYRSVVGASGTFVTHGLQSFTDRDDVLPNDSLFSDGLNAQPALSTTKNKFFNGSLIAARKFGSRDQTSVGFSYERFTSNGQLFGKPNLENPEIGVENGNSSSSFRVYRTNAAFGVKHDFGVVKFGAFYRFGKFTALSRRRQSSFLNPLTNFRYAESEGSSSEIGFRLQGLVSSRLFYGVEGGILSGRSREEFEQTGVVDSKQRTKTGRGNIGIGIGYFLREQTIFSFDVSGGFIKADQKRSEVFTGNLLENDNRRTSFLSAHAAVQTDVWSNLFVSASIQTTNQLRTIDSALFPDRFGRRLNSGGIFIPDGQARDSFTDLYSNYGIGWRFKPNFIFQYILTTDYGKTVPRHAVHFRYTFNFSKE